MQKGAENTENTEKRLKHRRARKARKAQKKDLKHRNTLKAQKKDWNTEGDGKHGRYRKIGILDGRTGVDSVYFGGGVFAEVSLML